MADRTIRVRLQAEVASYIAGLKQAATATSEFGRNISGVGSARAADIEKVGRAALLMGGAVALGLGAAAKAAIDWESSWAGVTKTVEGTAAELSDLQDGLRAMARELPATHGEIAAVAEAAGALGIATPAVESFTRTMIDLGETTDLTADQAANAFARIANIMQTPQSEFERMGSTVVDLGNNLAATESEITEMALRIAGAGHQVGLAETDVLGFAGALASVGIEAEAGGSAISRVFIKIDQAVREGGEELETFATTAGMTAEQFTIAYRDDAAGAIVSFIEGLDRMSASGGNVFGVLDELELSEIRVRDALLRAAGAGDLFRESLELGSQAWEENSALAIEAEKRYETTAAQFEILRNQITDLGVDIGAQLLPILRDVGAGVSQLIAGFQALPSSVQTGATAAAALAAGLLLTVGVVATLAPKIIAAKNALMTMGVAAQFLGRNLTLMMGVAGAALLVIGAIAYAMGESAQKARESEQRINGMALAMRDAADAAAGLGNWLTDFLRATPGLTGVLAEAEVSVDQLRSALQGSDDDFAAFRDQIVGIAEDSGLSGIALDVVGGALDQLRTEAGLAETQAGDLNVVLGDSEGVGEAAAGGLDAAGGAASSAATDFEKLEDAIKAYMDTLRASTDPLFGVINAQRRHADAQRNVTRSEQAVADAAQRLADLRADPEATARDIARAEQDVVDAYIAVEDAQLAVYDSAFDVEQAQADLSVAMQTGGLSADDAAAALQRLVDQGLLTQEQLNAMLPTFDALIGRVQTLDTYSDIALIVTANTTQVVTALDGVITMIQTIYGLVPKNVGVDFIGPLIDGQTRTNEYAGPGYGSFTDGRTGQAGGGWAGSNTWGPTDVIPTKLSPGEFVLSAQGASTFSPSELYGMNQGLRPAASPGGTDPMLLAALQQMSRGGFQLHIDTVIGEDTAGQVERGARRVFMSAFD